MQRVLEVTFSGVNMKNYLIFATAFLFAVGCQKNELPQTQTGGDTAGSPVVQAADGSMYSVQCLRTNASQIQSSGASAMAQCKVDLNAAVPVRPP